VLHCINHFLILQIPFVFSEAFTQPSDREDSAAAATPPFTLTRTIRSRPCNRPCFWGWHPRSSDGFSPPGSLQRSMLKSIYTSKTTWVAIKKKPEFATQILQLSWGSDTTICAQQNAGGKPSGRPHLVPAHGRNSGFWPANTKAKEINWRERKNEQLFLPGLSSVPAARETAVLPEDCTETTATRRDTAWGHPFTGIFRVLSSKIP